MRGPALPLLALLAGCAVAPPPATPDPIAGGDRREGMTAAGPSETGFCVAQMVPPAAALLIPEGAVVRPLAGGANYALMLRGTESGTAWSRQVEAGDAATAARLDRALADCAPGAPR
jgi:hypothetical protein